jgi:CheY-like chemotaxis protein
MMAGLAIVVRQQRLVRRLEGEKARLAAELARGDELRDAVRTARRISHDMNNVLATIAGYAQLLRRGMDSAHPLQRRVDSLLKAMDRATALTAELLERSRAAVGDETATSGAAATSPATPAPVDDRPTILLVEDEASLREILGEVLDDAGYRVLPAATADDALAAVRAHRGPIHLMLADVNLPGTSGPELAAQLQFLHAAARVLYMSGHSEEIVARRGVVHPVSLLLQKPFTPTTLLHRVQESLATVMGTPRAEVLTA